MLSNIIRTIISELDFGGVENVYSAFDAVSLERKNKGIFTVVGVNSFESSAPIYSQYTIFVPFKAEIGISVTAPESSSLEQLYNYYDEKVSPVINKLSGLSSSIRGMTIKFDSAIHRLVLTAKLLASGITRIERSGT